MESQFFLGRLASLLTCRELEEGMIYLGRKQSHCVFLLASQQMHSYAVKYSPPTDHLTLPFDHLYSSVKQRTSTITQMEKWLMGERFPFVTACIRP